MYMKWLPIYVYVHYICLYISIYGPHVLSSWHSFHITCCHCYLATIVPPAVLAAPLGNWVWSWIWSHSVEKPVFDQLESCIWLCMMYKIGYVGSKDRNFGFIKNYLYSLGEYLCNKPPYWHWNEITLYFGPTIEAVFL